MPQEPPAERPSLGNRVRVTKHPTAWEQFRNRPYLDARRDGNTFSVFHDEPDGLDLYYLGWCHGPPGTARLFYKLASLTGDENWMTVVHQAANTILQSGIPEQQTPGFWNNVSQCCGHVGVGEFMLALCRLGYADRYRAFLDRVTSDLLRRATEDESGMSWIQAEHRARPVGEIKRPPPRRPVIAVSRGRGSGGLQIAERLAERLGCELFDKQIIEYIIQASGVKREIVESLDERTRSSIELWVEGLLKERHFDESEFMATLARTITSIAGHGGVVIVGRGACFILHPSNSFRVRVVAPQEDCIRRLMETDGLDRDSARREIERADDERRRFVERHFKRRIDDPSAYDLIVNTEQVTLEAATDAILAAARLGSRVSG